MPSKPIIPGDSLGAMILKKWMSLEDDLANQLVASEIPPATPVPLHLMDLIVQGG